MSCLQTIRAFNGRDNTSTLVFGVVAANGDAELFDFTAATRFTMTFFVAGVETVIDTAITPNVIRAGVGDGDLVFDLGALSIPVGTYVADLVVFSVANPAGYFLDASDGHTLILDIR